MSHQPGSHAAMSFLPRFLGKDVTRSRTQGKLVSPGEEGVLGTNRLHRTALAGPHTLLTIGRAQTDAHLHKNTSAPTSFSVCRQSGAWQHDNQWHLACVRACSSRWLPYIEKTWRRGSADSTLYHSARRTMSVSRLSRDLRKINTR